MCYCHSRWDQRQQIPVFLPHLAATLCRHLSPPHLLPGLMNLGGQAGPTNLWNRGEIGPANLQNQRELSLANLQNHWELDLTAVWSPVPKMVETMEQWGTALGKLAEDCCH